VKVRGQRKHITSIKKEDVAAVADVSNINSTGTHEININVILPYGGVELLEQNPQHITVTVDEIVVAEKEILINQTGNPKASYCVSDYKVTPEKVKIKGPKSIVSTIEQLSVDVDVGGKDEDVTIADAPISFIGTSGEIFNTPYVTLEKETADVHCTIAKKKTVAIEANFSDGVNYVLAETAIKSIEIAGDDAVIEKIEKIKTSVITNEMISENGEVEVLLELPEGVKSLAGDKITLKLKTVSH
jgi:YbbR domain-containing protein